MRKIAGIVAVAFILADICLGFLAYFVSRFDRSTGNAGFRALRAAAAAGLMMAMLVDTAVAGRLNGTRGPLTNHDEARRAVAAAMGDTIVGVASMYNPYRLRDQEGGTKTASGEPYDPDAWAAAIQIGLRAQFGGVRYGKDYRHRYALVETSERRVIVKINDVGPLKSGRIIDLNEKTMRYFDPTLRLGLIHHIRVTPLLGDGWTAGPIEGDGLIRVAYQWQE